MNRVQSPTRFWAMMWSEHVKENRQGHHASGCLTESHEQVERPWKQWLSQVNRLLASAWSQISPRLGTV